jgi:hypothetical protein
VETAPQDIPIATHHGQFALKAAIFRVMKKTKHRELKNHSEVQAKTYIPIAMLHHPSGLPAITAHVQQRQAKNKLPILQRARVPLNAAGRRQGL